MERLLSIFLAACFVINLQADDIDTIAFGSCAKERLEQPVWNAIIKKKPDLFLFIGDNNYADFWEKDGKLRSAPVDSVDRLKEAYRVMSEHPGFKKMQQTAPMMAVWDDHDYGANDYGKEYGLKEQAQTVFLDTFGFAKDDPIREQQGIYHSRTFGSGDRKVQIIMLDTRYHRDALTRRAERKAGFGPYVPDNNPQLSMLGEAQWQWLEQQLKQPAAIRLIISSIQVVAWEHGWETWGNFPRERQRLYDLVAKTQAKGVVFLSGDRHLMELSQDVGQTGASVPYPMWDFTSSGMNQKPGAVDDINSHRIGPVERQTNFGTVTIDWSDTTENTLINLNGFDEQGRLLTRQTLFLNQLQATDNQ